MCTCIHVISPATNMALWVKELATKPNLSFNSWYSHSRRETIPTFYPSAFTQTLQQHVSAHTKNKSPSRFHINEELFLLLAQIYNIIYIYIEREFVSCVLKFRLCQFLSLERLYVGHCSVSPQNGINSRVISKDIHYIFIIEITEDTKLWFKNKQQLTK